jgi:hypothetical protein
MTKPMNVKSTNTGNEVNFHKALDRPMRGLLDGIENHQLKLKMG